MEGVSRAEELSQGAPARRRPGRLALLVAAIALQAACAVFFVADVVVDLATDLAVAGGGENSLGHNLVELLAALGLSLGVAFLWHEFRRVAARQDRMADQLRVAAGAFHELLLARFDDWGLTPAERDVALLLVKGLSLAEIAALRDSAEGTVKAHCNKVYAKADVSGRTQLTSLFVEDLMADALVAPAPGPAPQRPR